MTMNREEKIATAIEKGFTCDITTGKIYGIRGREITTKNTAGYIMIGFKVDDKAYLLYGHQFIYYMANKEIVRCIDHINGIKSDNRIENLRSVSQKLNTINPKNKRKGYTWNKQAQKWRAQISINNEIKHLGSFTNENDARQAYLNMVAIREKTSF